MPRLRSSRIRLVAAGVIAAASVAILVAPAGAAPVGTRYPATNAFLRPVVAPSIFAFSAPTHCAAARLSGMTVLRCGTAASAIGTVIWSVQRSSSGRRAMVVFEQTGIDWWKPKLRANEQFAGEWSDARAVVGDPDSDGKQEILAGIRHAGTGGYLDLDIVDIRSGHVKVTGHVDSLAKGRARLSPGRVLIAEGRYTATDPTCCPSFIDWNRLAYSPSVGWYAASRAVRATSAAPLWTNQFVD